MDIIRMGGLDLRFLQTKDSTGGSLDLFEMTCQPNARMPVPHYHEGWDETVYGLVGITVWTVGGHDIEVRPGDSTFIPRKVVHGFRNDTQQPAKVLSILTPGVLGPGYFKEMAAIIESGGPDPARMKATMLRHGLIPVP